MIYCMGVMSRIRGIEAKVQKETAQTLESRRNKYTEGGKKKNEISNKIDTERHQISELLYKLPKLNQIFDVHRKIGEGTFSSVYLGSLKQHAQLPEDQKRWFAIKHLVPTAHPARIEHELRCLQDMGGKDYVIGVDLCLRHLDTIVFIMPYIPHRKFSEYVGDMDTEEVRRYMRALLVALRHVHSFGVIHRDVKPSNFLYDRENKRYLLVDFGLAQRVVTSEKPQLAALTPSPAPPPAHSNNLKRPREEDDTPPSEKRIALDLSTRVRCTNSISPIPRRLALPKVQIPKQNLAKVPPGGCSCSNAGAVCSPCSLRAAARAPRAGTQGFRPPEVLLKSPRQGPGVDMWAAGVVLASLLTARYPFFRAADDASALAELADLLGTRPLQRAAAALGRRMVTSQPRRGLCLRKLAARLRGSTLAPAASPNGPPAPACAHCRLPRPHCLCANDTLKASDISPGVLVAGFPDAAFSLAARLLEPDPRLRASAADALNHPFLAD